MNRIWLMLPFVCLFALPTSNGHRDVMLEYNRTPKVSSSLRVSSVCEECHAIIKRLKAAASDPQKIAELKILLSALCHEVSFETECMNFVKYLDIFLAELLPHLDPEKTCKELHLCSNWRIELFHMMQRVKSAFYKRNDFLCDECQFAVDELKRLVDNPAIREDVTRFIDHEICDHLGQYSKSCDIIANDFVPQFFNELSQMLGNKRRFCEDLKLCSGPHTDVPRETSRRFIKFIAK
ncbi:saposin precursor [Aphelenchoides avenae]|nr:saposin precursor [Aphelenchus avenae]